MSITQIIQDTSYSHRTQISLSPSMYKKVMKEKGGVSLAEYIRLALVKFWEAESRIKTQKQDQQQQARKILAKGLPGKPPSVKEVLKWQKELRKGRL